MGFSKMKPTATDGMEGRVWSPGVFPESRSEVFTNAHRANADTTEHGSRTPHLDTCHVTGFSKAPVL